MANELQGVADLTRRLNKLDGELRIKAFRSVLFKATTPVIQQMRSRIPVGDTPHRTPRGNTLVPGFAKRSIKRLTGKKFINRGRLSIAIGVKRDAWYSFLYDQGPYTISTRRQRTNIKARGHFGTQRRNINIRPYTLRRQAWFESVFRSNERRMLTNIKNNLKKQVEAVSRG